MGYRKDLSCSRNGCSYKCRDDGSATNCATNNSSDAHGASISGRVFECRRRDGREPNASLMEVAASRDGDLVSNEAQLADAGRGGCWGRCSRGSITRRQLVAAYVHKARKLMLRTFDLNTGGESATGSVDAAVRCEARRTFLLVSLFNVRVQTYCVRYTGQRQQG